MCVNTSTFESAFFRLLGYLDNPEATAQTIDSKGWLHTGDIARYDEDGYFFIVGRIKELIKYKGFQVLIPRVRSSSLSGCSVHRPSLFSEEN